MQLIDAFIRRKQINAEIEKLISRLKLSGKESKIYSTRNIEGPDAFKPMIGTLKEYTRTYTNQELQTQLNSLSVEDRELALRISITNQKAVGTFIDLDGIEKTCSIPELLVLRNEIAPNLEKVLRALPRQDTDIEVVERGEGYIRTRAIQKVQKRRRRVYSEQDQVEEDIEYNIQEYVDFGIGIRAVYDEIDRIHEFLARIKEAINIANRTELIFL